MPDVANNEENSEKFDINKDILDAHDNLKEASNEVDKQGGQIDNTLDKLEEANEDIKNSDQTMNSIIRRKKIYKLFLIVLTTKM